MPDILDQWLRSIFDPEIGAEKPRKLMAEAFLGWLTRSSSMETRRAYARDVALFFRFMGIDINRLEELSRIRPFDVAAWRDHLRQRGLAFASVSRKITVLRSMFSYLQVHRLTPTDPAHRDLVATPPVPRDGKTVGLSPHECRRVLDAPALATPVGIRDRALLAILAYTGCRVGELCRMRVGDIKMTGGHRIIEIRGKGDKERRVPLNPEASERIEAWLDFAELRDGPDSALFFAGEVGAWFRKGWLQPATSHVAIRAVELLVARYVRLLGLDPAVTVHSFRVTALTTARECGCDLVDVQTFAGHCDPKTTLSYIRNRDRLNKSPAYVLAY